ncbi:serine phosphatase RsbU (regulator of sigma subunit) [Streptomyces sp. PanSC19]|uniref:PP2C family protein-serine/threonine phosphatase n=1 Tax=Streptomyces sp. PanSC19 TaxID=1520455 RepID=UPI000FC3C839|nr:PP2C family protein-serine/threonine phosphatase [Streptomyces sp. PanSC19]ROQ26429.1 serine phosphatase RsbU (regulator of sigma subunit) [Streptomyces sp. PanSC19]
MTERDEALSTRARALEQAIGEIGTTLDETTTCRELAVFLAHHLHGAVTVDLLDEQGAPARRAASADVLPSGAPARRAASADILPSGAPASGPAASGASPDGPVASGASAPGPAVSRASRAGADETQAFRVGADEPRASRAGADEPRASTAPPDVPSLAVPLAVHDEAPLGTVIVTRHGPGFSADEVAVLRQAARLAARHLGHARRLVATEDTALHLQRALVAEPGRPHPNLEIAGGYLPAGPRALVGGDWFETVRLHFGRSLLVVGDVMGHGLDAAVDMNAYRTALREAAATDLPPHRVLRHLDSVVAEDDARRPATCLLVQVDPARGTATFASAGHLPPAVFGPDGSAEIVDLPVGPPLGTGVGGYEPTTRPLAPGETLLIFTDGLVERRGEDIDLSLARLAALRLPAGSGPERVVEEVLHRLGAHHAEDDVAVLAARVRTRPAS